MDFPGHFIGEGQANPLFSRLAQITGKRADGPPIYVITGPLGAALRPGRMCIKKHMAELLGHFRQQEAQGEDGAEPENKALFDKWIIDGRRRMLHGVVIRPGLAPLSITPDEHWNNFPGYATRPRRCDKLVAFYLAWLRAFFSVKNLAGERELPAENAALMRQFLQWQAHLLKFPEVRRTTSWTFLAEAEGIGKSLALSVPAYIIGMDTGQGAAVLSNEAIESDWTEWAGSCIYAFFDEPSTKKKSVAGRLRMWRTAPRIEVNTKYGAKFSVPNMLTMGFATNADFAFSISADARRDWVFSPEWEASEVYEGHTWEAWCTELGRRISSEVDPSMREALLYHFLNEVDLSDYDPRGRAGESEAKRVAAEASRAAAESNEDEAWQWVAGVIAEHGAFFVASGRLGDALKEAGIDMPLRAFQALCRVRGLKAGLHVHSGMHRFGGTGALTRCYYVGQQPWSAMSGKDKDRAARALLPWAGAQEEE